jgi:YfiH family protein
VSKRRPPEGTEPAIGRLGVLECRLGPGIRGVFTTRYGGVSAAPYAFANLAVHVGDSRRRTRTNLELLAATVGAGRVNFPQQVHGRGVLVVDETRAGNRRITVGGAPGVDALVTRLPRTPLGVRAGDCMPVLFADPASRVVGAAHAGRRGLVEGVLQSTIAGMVGLGAEPARITAVVGPSVCGRCYEVPAEMRAEVDAVVPGCGMTTERGTPSLDLAKGAVTILEALGVATIKALEICTVEDERFYSFRRSRETGRFAGVVMLDADD